jgi:hypothetical protein
VKKRIAREVGWRAGKIVWEYLKNFEWFDSVFG